MFTFLAGRSWGRSLLLNYPGFFSRGMISHEGPSQQQMDETTFETVLFCKGYSAKPQSRDQPHDRQLVVKVSGAEPGYVATPAIMVQCALTLLDDRELMPGNGGVFTTASAFHNTKLIERLSENGLNFEVCEKN